MPTLTPVNNLELLSLILGDLPRRDLAACVRVNQFWNEVTIPMLYRHVVVGKPRPYQGPIKRRRKTRFTHIKAGSRKAKKDGNGVDLGSINIAYTKAVTIYPHTSCTADKLGSITTTGLGQSHGNNSSEEAPLILSNTARTLVFDMNFDFAGWHRRTLFHYDCPLLNLKPEHLVIWNPKHSDARDRFYTRGIRHFTQLKSTIRRVTFIVRFKWSKILHPVLALPSQLNTRIVFLPEALEYKIIPGPDNNALCGIQNGVFAHLSFSCCQVLFRRDAVYSKDTITTLYLLVPLNESQITFIERRVREMTLNGIIWPHDGNGYNPYITPEIITARRQKYIDKVQPVIDNIRIKSLAGFLEDHYNGNLEQVFDNEQVEGWAQDYDKARTA